jgi:ABC-type lipoprotein release transport system permease subunit
MFDYALKNITKRCGRSLLTALGVTLMVTLVIVVTGIVDYQMRKAHEHASASAGKIHVQPFLAGTGYPAEGVDMPEEVADDLLNRNDLQSTLSGKVLYLALQAPRFPNEPPQVILTGIERGKEEAFTGSIANDVKPLAGVEFFAQTDAAWPVILGFQAADYYARQVGQPLQPGDTLTILDQAFTVVGLLDSSADQVVNNSLIVPLDLAQRLVDKLGFVSAVILIPERVGAEQTIIADVQSRYPRLTIVTDDRMRRNLAAGMKLFEDMITAISIVVIVGAALLVMTVTLINVRERTREIGVLRALGAPVRAVVGAVVWEIFLLSLAGSLLGGIISGFILRFGMLENLFNLGHIVKYLPLAVVITLAAGVAPAFKISRIAPVESLRYE